ncbi:MAG: hypothetical protein ACKOZY_13130 [Flavobacteriales bacterium]
MRFLKMPFHSLLLVTGLMFFLQTRTHGQEAEFAIQAGRNAQRSYEWSADEWKSSYALNLSKGLDSDYYDKVIINFGRLDEFRSVNRTKIIEFQDGSGSIIIYSWKELGIEGQEDGKFSASKVEFVINSNAQLKEQFIE